MTGSCKAFRVGTRNCRLSQARSVIDSFEALFPDLRFETVPLPECDLPRAIACGNIDCAVDGAEHLPDPMLQELDWCWLPWREDPRDAIVLPAGRSLAEPPSAPVIGVPEGQGRLALSFRAGDARFLRLRSLFVRAVTFVGAGAGNYDSCTLAGARELQRAEVCFHDSLLDTSLLDALPSGAKSIDVGKRCGRHGFKQPEISRLISVEARKGYRVVRLKGGDPGIFGRLAEEVEALDELHLPYHVLPGV